MSNELIETNEQSNIPAPKVPVTAGAQIAGLVPTTLEEAFRLANAVSQAGLAPYGLNTPQQVLIAILTGLETGLPPMSAIQSIAIIGNRPSIWGDGLLAIVRRSPLCTYIKEWIEGEGDKRIAFCETHRKGEPEPVRRSFSAQDAMDAGLWQTQPIIKKKSKDGGFYDKPNDSPWFKYKARMLQMRARAWCLRDVYADITKGMAVREEMEDLYGRSEPRDVTPSKPTLVERLAGNSGSSLIEHINRETGEITEVQDATESPTEAQDGQDASEATQAAPEGAEPATDSPAPENDPSEWAEDTLLDMARGKANEGGKVWRFFKGKLSVEEQRELAPHMDELNRLASAA